MFSWIVCTPKLYKQFPPMKFHDPIYIYMTLQTETHLHYYLYSNALLASNVSATFQLLYTDSYIKHFSMGGSEK